jgi:transposase
LALSTVGGFIKRKRDTGSVSPVKLGGHKTFSLTPRTDLVKALVAEQPDSTLAEFKVRLAKKNVKVSQSAIIRFLRAAGGRSFTVRASIDISYAVGVGGAGRVEHLLVRAAT